MGLNRFFRNRKAIDLKRVVLIIVALMSFVIVAMYIFPAIADLAQISTGLVKECRRPEFRIEKYADEVNASLDILRGIKISDPSGIFSEIKIDADEFAIGVDQEMYACVEEGYINQSELNKYDLMLFGPSGDDAPPPRRMEVIYKEFILGLTSNDEPGYSKQIKEYISVYRDRFPIGEFKAEVTNAINVYKGTIAISSAGNKLTKTLDVSEFKRVLELIRKQFKQAESDPDLAYRTHSKVRRYTRYFVFGSEYGLKIRVNATSADLQEGLIEYGRTVDLYLDTAMTAVKDIEDLGKTDSEKKLNKDYASLMKSRIKQDILEVLSFAKHIEKQGKTAASNALMSELSKIDAETINYFTGVNSVSEIKGVPSYSPGSGSVEQSGPKVVPPTPRWVDPKNVPAELTKTETEGMYSYDAPSATRIWYRCFETDWEWSPDLTYWMSASTTVVSEGGKYAGREPVEENIALINLLHEQDDCEKSSDKDYSQISVE